MEELFHGLPAAEREMAKPPDRSPPVELDPPASALEATWAVEVLRAWIADGDLHVTLQPDNFSGDAGQWGRVLADICHHIARGVALAGQLTEREAMAAIVENFDRGVSAPSTVSSGAIPRRTQH